MRIWVGKTELDGVRSTSIIWSRFNSKKTIATGGTKLFRTAILENLVNCTIPAPCTDRDTLEQIARQSQPPMPIESLSDVLNKTVHPRGRTLLGFCGNRIDEIARNYPSMQWWVSKNGLHMEVIPDSKLSDFDALAGRLMFEARPRRESWFCASSTKNMVWAPSWYLRSSAERFLAARSREDCAAVMTSSACSRSCTAFFTSVLMPCCTAPHLVKAAPLRNQRRTQVGGGCTVVNGKTQLQADAIGGKVEPTQLRKVDCTELAVCCVTC
jgi:hypothetical protein